MTKQEYDVIEAVMYALIAWFGEDARGEVFIKPLRLLLENSEHNDLAL